MIWPSRSPKAAPGASAGDPLPLDEGSFDEDLM
jgi:hypothetical protein